MCNTDTLFQCGDTCIPRSQNCDGVQHCPNGEDELNCGVDTALGESDEAFDDPTLTIVMPTIAACIILVFLMLVGIKKCKQWELDHFMEMRRTRRIMERLTATLREKNVKLIQKAKVMRNQNKGGVERTKHAPLGGPPPRYGVEYPLLAADSVHSPPPSYEDILLDAAADECADRLGRLAAPYSSKYGTADEEDGGFLVAALRRERRSTRRAGLPRAYSVY